MRSFAEHDLHDAQLSEHFIDMEAEPAPIREGAACGQDRTWLIVMLKVDPVWDPLRGEERFAALVRRLNFPDS